jgi:hypothetical protein
MDITTFSLCPFLMEGPPREKSTFSTGRMEPVRNFVCEA